MIDYFYNYIKTLIIFLVFMSFMQIILPSNKYKSYINLVFGMMLIYIMIRPINHIYDSIENIDALNVFNTNDIALSDKDQNFDYGEYEEIQNDMIKDAFTQNVKLQVQKLIKNEYFIEDININLCEDKYKEIKIDKIELSLKKENQDVYVKPFGEYDKMEESKNDEINDIKKVISEFYILPMDNIFIKIA